MEYDMIHTPIDEMWATATVENRTRLFLRLHGRDQTSATTGNQLKWIR